jgi:hypothetical protein
LIAVQAGSLRTGCAQQGTTFWKLATAASIRVIECCWSGQQPNRECSLQSDTDFGQLVFLDKAAHCGVVRLPDVPAKQRVLIMEDLLTRFSQQLADRAIITVRGGRVRISRSESDFN